jgi:hypothetical protein
MGLHADLLAQSSFLYTCRASPTSCRRPLRGTHTSSHPYWKPCSHSGCVQWGGPLGRWDLFYWLRPHSPFFVSRPTFSRPHLATTYTPTTDLHTLQTYTYTCPCQVPDTDPAWWILENIQSSSAQVPLWHYGPDPDYAAPLLQVALVNHRGWLVGCPSGSESGATRHQLPCTLLKQTPHPFSILLCP